MEHNPEGKQKFDPIKILGQVLTYARHIRLMMLMGAVGICAGLVVYLYSVPTYQAKSLVAMRTYYTAMKGTGMPDEMGGISINSRTFLRGFPSRLIQLGAAKRLGLVGERATFEEVLTHVPNVTVSLFDASHVEVTVYAFDPEVVTSFAQAMVEEYQDHQQKSWLEFRDRALERYAIQVRDLEQKVADTMEEMTAMERDQRLTEISIEQQSLLEIPKDLVTTKEKLARMDGIRQIMAKFEDVAPPGAKTDSGDLSPEQTLTLLSLLSGFEKESDVQVGDVIQTNLPGTSTIRPSPAKSRIVVEPSKVEGLDSWRDLEKQKRLLEDQLTEAAKTYLPDHEIMRNLRAQYEEVQRSLMTEVRVMREKFNLEYSRLEEKLSVLESRIPEYQNVTEKLGKSSLAFSNIENAQSMWDSARETLAKSLASITFNKDFDWVELAFQGHISVRDKIPVSPSKSKIAMISLLLAVAGAVGVPTVLNLLSTSANTVHQLEDTTGLLGLGIVPLASKDYIEEVHRSPAQGATVPNYLLECFRVIRSNICLNPNQHQRSQVILITSSRPQEGKTTQAANLAWAFHSMGERTLLIDCDLRRGRVHLLLGLDNTNGMTGLLPGNLGVPESIQRTGLELFDAIPRGPVVAGTTEILCQDRFAKLIAHFREHYDRIILDTPPVLGLSETSSLQRVVDGTVIVVRAEKTSRKDVLDAVNLLKKSGAYIFGFVLNAVDLSKASNYYNYYYYSAPYYDQFEPDNAPARAGKASEAWR